MEIIKIKEQSINAEESKLYKKMLDSLGDCINWVYMKIL